MSFKLPASVYSPVLVEGVVIEAHQYLEWHRDKRVREKVGQSPAEEPTFSAETAATIEAWFDGRPPTVEGLEGLMAHLQNLKVPVVHVTLAALPNHIQRLSLINWFRANVSADVLLAFAADRTLGGGAVIRTPSHIYDLSWRQRLVDGRSKLGEIVKNV